jgi:uncharacterized protein YggE
VAVVPAQPDEVALDLTVTYVDRSPEAALAETARRSEALIAILDELSIGRERWTTSGVSISEESEWDEQARRQVHRGYRATNRLALRLADGALIGTLLREATGRASAAVRGPFWSVAPDNPAHSEARQAAAQDARRRADAYATALGGRIGAILDVTEPGLQPRPVQEQRAYSRQAMMVADAVPNIEVQAGELHVSAAIVVTFALEQG